MRCSSLRVQGHTPNPLSKRFISSDLLGKLQFKGGQIIGYPVKGTSMRSGAEAFTFIQRMEGGQGVEVDWLRTQKTCSKTPYNPTDHRRALVSG